MFVALLYVINSVGIMGIIPGAQLANSVAPYADAAQFIFGGNLYLVISFISFIVLFGTLNAWVLTSGQIALGLAQDNLMPAIFAKKNKFDAPIWGLALSCLGTIALLILTASESLADQVVSIVKISTTAFLLVYAICCLAFFKLLFKKKEDFSKIIYPLLYGSLALIFCSWMIYKAELNELLIASLFTLSGVPFYLYYKIKKNK
jgi:APA family basic amino acid/polyamine antiporter